MQPASWTFGEVSKRGELYPGPHAGHPGGACKNIVCESVTVGEPVVLQLSCGVSGATFAVEFSRGASCVTGGDNICYVLLLRRQALILRMWHACRASVTSGQACTTCQAPGRGTTAQTTTGTASSSSSNGSRRLPVACVQGAAAAVATDVSPVGLLRCACAPSSYQAVCLSATGWTTMRLGQHARPCAHSLCLRCLPHVPHNLQMTQLPAATVWPATVASPQAASAVRTAGLAAGRAAAPQQALAAALGWVGPWLSQAAWAVGALLLQRRLLSGTCLCTCLCGSAGMSERRLRPDLMAGSSGCWRLVQTSGAWQVSRHAAVPQVGGQQDRQVHWILLARPYCACCSHAVHK
jgi:hypothetical protein